MTETASSLDFDFSFLYQSLLPVRKADRHCRIKTFDADILLDFFKQDFQSPVPDFAPICTVCESSEGNLFSSNFKGKSDLLKTVRTFLLAMSLIWLCELVNRFDCRPVPTEPNPPFSKSPSSFAVPADYRVIINLVEFLIQSRGIDDFSELLSRFCICCLPSRVSCLLCL